MPDRFCSLIFSGFLSMIRRFVLLSSFALASPVLAQATSAKDSLSTVIVTATRVPVSTVAPTASATVLRGDDLRAQGITRVVDALQLVPGAAMVQSGPIGSQSSLFLRGGNSNYVRVLVDGVPLNDAGGSLDFSAITTANIDRIEIVRGPTSVLYGSDAVTGVIQLFTKQGTGPAALRAEIGGGSFGTVRGQLGLSGGNARAGFSVDGFHSATNGILAFNNRNVNDALSASLRANPDSKTDARLALRWTSASYQYPTESDGAVKDHNAEQSEHRFVVSADAGRRITDRFEVRGSLQSNEYLPRSNDGPDNKGDTLGFYGYYSRAARTRRTADLRAVVKYDERGTLVVGADISHERESNTSVSLSEYGPFPGAFEVSRHNTGVYAQAVGDAASRLSYVVGGRVDQNSAFGAFQTLRVGLAYLVNEGVKLRASVGSAFKAPSFYENFATGYVTGNPNLQPERSRSAELGVESFFADGALRIAVTGYLQKFTNVVQYAGTAPVKGGPNYYNVAAADANGVELETSYRGLEKTVIALNYSYLDSKTTQAGFDKSASANYVVGEKLIRRAPHTISASVARLFGEGGSVTLVANRIGDRDDRDFAVYPAKAIVLPAYMKVDLSTVVPVSRSLSLVARADNLFGAKYSEIAHFAAPGTVLYAGVRLAR
jgi:vitamin B12 transporter